MNPETAHKTSFSRAELLWFGAVVVLSAIAIFGSFEPDTFRRFAPKDTVLYSSWQENGERFSRAYLADGSTADLSDGGGVTVSTYGTTSDTHIDPFPNATPWQNLRMRFSSAYGVFMNNGSHELLFGARENGTTELQSSIMTTLQGTSVNHLPASLLLWSSDDEPIAAMPSTNREPSADAEGRYGRADAPDVVLRATVPDSDAFLKLLTAFGDPKTSQLPLGDGSSATEIIADNEAIQLQHTTSVIGQAVTVNSLKTVPALIPLNDADPNGISTLIWSDSSVLQEHSSWHASNCPISSLTSFVKSPFFALGSSDQGNLVFCSE